MPIDPPLDAGATQALVRGRIQKGYTVAGLPKKLVLGPELTAEFPASE